jgi:hypothetical protein
MYWIAQEITKPAFVHEILLSNFSFNLIKRQAHLNNCYHGHGFSDHPEEALLKGIMLYIISLFH